MLPLANPLDTPVTFAAAINNPEVSVPASLTVEAHSKADELPIEWRPLLPKVRGPVGNFQKRHS